MTAPTRSSAFLFCFAWVFFVTRQHVLPFCCTYSEAGSLRGSAALLLFAAPGAGAPCTVPPVSPGPCGDAERDHPNPAQPPERSHPALCPQPACCSGERERRFCFCTVDMSSDLRHEVRRVVCCLRTCSALCSGLPNGREGWTQGARAAADLASSLCLFCYTDISKDSPKMYYCTKIAA